MTGKNTLRTHLVADCQQFLEKYDFDTAVDSPHEFVVKNTFCSIHFQINKANELAVVYSNIKTSRRFCLKEIIEFSFTLEERRIFQTLFFKNLVKNKIWPLMTKMMLHFLDQNKPEIFLQDGLFLQDGRWMPELIKKVDVKNVRAGIIFKRFFHTQQLKRSLYQGNLSWRTRFHEYFKENNLRTTGTSALTLSRTMNGWTRLLDAMGKMARGNFTPPRNKQ